jgi:N-acetylated-alpha-linked acidic dipeptidase
MFALESAETTDSNRDEPIRQRCFRQQQQNRRKFHWPFSIAAGRCSIPCGIIFSFSEFRRKLNSMKRTLAVLLYIFILATVCFAQATARAILGFRDSAAETALEKSFLAVPDPALAGEELRVLTAAPHIAGSPEDHATAEYVAGKFREAGLETQIVEYKVWLNYPSEISVDVVAPASVKMHGPTREHVDGDPFENDPRIVMPFNAYSPSGNVNADVVYANYGRPEDIQKLKDMGVDIRGKILLVRYGHNFRGVKTFVAEQAGAAGVIIYSDPADDGWVKGDMYPVGPWRPDTGVQRGSVGYMFRFPGDPTTPGIASVMTLPDSKRTPPEQSAEMPKVPTTPLSYADAQPILQNLGGAASPRDWQGALPFTYHVGPGPVRVKMHLKQDYAYRTIWDVIGTVPGSENPEQWVVAGNHRDAWVYGAVDPNSGSAAQLEAVHGIGELLKSGWKPKRTMVFASWDAEEYGLVGSTEWGEQHEKDLANAVAYFNTDVGVAGPNFGASAVPSLKRWIREITMSVPSPKGGTVYDDWRSSERAPSSSARHVVQQVAGAPDHEEQREPSIGDLGSGSDYTVFLQHLGVPSTDISSYGPYGVYHSAFDDYAWFTKFADPKFAYEQEMARIFGLEALRMAAADVLPYDYEEYGKEISRHLDAARRKAHGVFGETSPDFSPAQAAAKRLTQMGAQTLKLQQDPKSNAAELNHALIAAERGFLTQGLPNRPWFRHAIFAPGEYTGYEAVVLPGVNEGIDKRNRVLLQEQLAVLTQALDRVTKTLQSGR